MKDTLDSEDWDVLTTYQKLLEPCWLATLDLEGRPGDGKSCGISKVQFDLEFIVEELTAAYKRYKSASPATTEGQWHFSTQIKLALDKAEEYYAKLDDSPAYLAAAVLHPAYTWKVIESQWANNKSWITAGRKAVKSLWSSTYKQLPVSDTMSPVKKTTTHEPDTLEAFHNRAKSLAKARNKNQKAAIPDEFERYSNQEPTELEFPLEWWRTIGIKEYPHLAQMAFDFLSIPAISDEPERVFSRMGLIITTRRNHLEQPTIQAAQCLHSWDKANIISIKEAEIAPI
jgi:hypothetical protein